MEEQLKTTMQSLKAKEKECDSFEVVIDLADHNLQRYNGYLHIPMHFISVQNVQLDLLQRTEELQVFDWYSTCIGFK